MNLLHGYGNGLQISIKSKCLDALSEFFFDQPKQMTEIGKWTFDYVFLEN